MQSMQGKLDGIAMRVPVPTGSITDFTAVLDREASVEEINAAFAAAASEGRMSGVLDYTEDPIVSSDIVTSPASCTFDAGLTMAHGHAGQDRRLVRQRVGLLQPSRRHGPHRRCCQRSTSACRPRQPMTSSAFRNWRTSASIDGGCTASRFSSGSTSTCRCPTVRSPTTYGCGPRCRRCSGLQEQGATVTACSHLGRPKGEPNPEYSMDPVRAHLATLAPGVKLLENLRFNPGETANDPAFVDALVAGHDAYVNDAFGASHRAHASIVGPPTAPPVGGRSAAGQGGRASCSAFATSARRPFVAIMGGAKVSDKLSVIEALLGIVDSVIVGGGMAFTFLKAQGHDVGDSLLEEDMVDTCARLARQWRRPSTCPRTSPRSAVAASCSIPKPGERFARRASISATGWMGVDIGPDSAALFTDVILEAGTVLWNGPMGVFEDPRFEAGTRAIAEAMAETRAFTVVGGGDSAAAAKQFGVDGNVDHVSTGGGASLELIEQGDLPGPRRTAALNTTRTTRSRHDPHTTHHGNWKMHLNHFEALKLVQELSYQITTDDVDEVDISVHPPFTDLRTVQTVLEADRLPFHLGAQHCHFEEKGAFTGEVAPSMLAKMNVSYVIVGHSERREVFGETDEMVNAKVKAILANEMVPILCVGETLGRA